MILFSGFHSVKKALGLLMTGLLLLSSGVSAKPAEIRFVTEIMSPFQINDGNNLSGFAVEFVEELKRRTGITAEIEVYPWARAYNIALTEPNVFIFTLVKTDERMDKFNWIDDYYTVTDSFYALTSRDDIVVESMEDAKKYITCIPRNDVGEQRLMDAGFNEQSLKKVAFQSQCLGMLYRDRVDLNLFNEVGIRKLAQKFDVDPNYFRRVFVVSKAVMGLAASKSTDSELVAKVRKAVREIKSSPSHQKRVEKWFGK